MLAHYHEGLATGPPNTAAYKEQMVTACDLLSDLQVETYSSMDRREKTEFILEQMRLLVTVARLKDAELDKNGKEVLGGGESEWVKVRVGGRKINEEFLKEKDKEVRLLLNSPTIISTTIFIAGPQTQVLRFDDTTCPTWILILGCCKILLQGLGDAIHQRRRDRPRQIGTKSQWHFQSAN
jgi:hypothetical protein